MDCFRHFHLGTAQLSMARRKEARMDGQVLWAAIGAVGQIVTAGMAIVVAYMAVSFTKKTDIHNSTNKLK